MVGKIEIKKINQTYPSSNPDEDVIVALHEISETVEPGEFVALIGPSGCGKSTLLRLIAGLEQSDSGAILIDGNQVTGASQEIGLMFQEATLYPWKNIFENIAFGRKLKGRLSIE
ncbi:MAG: ATP-binding cassette domain-containing protein, partial [Streptococcaceae bacterium]|nr:ATP-binding cassette domain-containing protein [Streptococcaceae bacterium]